MKGGNLHFPIFLEVDSEHFKMFQKSKIGDLQPDKHASLFIHHDTIQMYLVVVGPNLKEVLKPLGTSWRPSAVFQSAEKLGI